MRIGTLPAERSFSSRRRFTSGKSGGSFTGSVRDEGAGSYAFAFQSHDTILAPRDSREEPLATDLIELTGIADLHASMLSLDRIIIQTQQGSFAGAGRLGFTGETPSFALAAELTPMSIATWKQMWPPFLAPGARRWAMDNILGGRIASARFEAAVPAGVLFRPERAGPWSRTPSSSTSSSRTRRFAPIGGLPPIAGASGHAVLAGSTFGVDLASGVVKTPSGHGRGRPMAPLPSTTSSIPAATAWSRSSFRAMPPRSASSPTPSRSRSSTGAAWFPPDLSGKADVSVSVRVPLDSHEAKDPEAAVDWKVVVAGSGLASSVAGRRPDVQRRRRDHCRHPG